MNKFNYYASHLTSFLAKRDLRHLIVHVTNHCNFRCDHCFIDFSQKKDLRLEDYEILGREAGSLFWLDIGGGEPFLRKDLADIIHAFDCQIVQIPSNGSLPDQMIRQINQMKEDGDREIIVSLSLDGPREVHDAIRGQPGSFDQVWETAARLRDEAGTYVKILSVLQNGNADTMIDFMREVRDRGPDYHSVILFRGEGINKEVCLPPLDVLKELGPEIHAIQESYRYGNNALSARILRNFHRYLWTVSLRTLEEERQVIPCLAGQSHMVVFGNGDVSSCEMLDPVGSLAEESWNEIVTGDAFKEQVRSIKNGECHCTHNCAMMDSILLEPKNLMKLIYQPIDRPRQT